MTLSLSEIDSLDANEVAELLDTPWRPSFPSGRLAHGWLSERRPLCQKTLIWDDDDTEEGRERCQMCVDRYSRLQHRDFLLNLDVEGLNEVLNNVRWHFPMSMMVRHAFFGGDRTLCGVPFEPGQHEWPGRHCSRCMDVVEELRFRLSDLLTQRGEVVAVVLAATIAQGQIIRSLIPAEQCWSCMYRYNHVSGLSFCEKGFAGWLHPGANWNHPILNCTDYEKESVDPSMT